MNDKSLQCQQTLSSRKACENAHGAELMLIVVTLRRAFNLRFPIAVLLLFNLLGIAYQGAGRVVDRVGRRWNFSAAAVRASLMGCDVHQKGMPMSRDFTDAFGDICKDISETQATKAAHADSHDAGDGQCAETELSIETVNAIIREIASTAPPDVADEIEGQLYQLEDLIESQHAEQTELLVDIKREISTCKALLMECRPHQPPARRRCKVNMRKRRFGAAS